MPYPEEPEASDRAPPDPSGSGGVAVSVVPRGCTADALEGRTDREGVGVTDLRSDSRERLVGDDEEVGRQRQAPVGQAGERGSPTFRTKRREGGWREPDMRREKLDGPRLFVVFLHSTEPAAPVHDADHGFLSGLEGRAHDLWLRQQRFDQPGLSGRRGLLQVPGSLLGEIVEVAVPSVSQQPSQMQRVAGIGLDPVPGGLR